MTKLKALEKIFAAEIEGRLPFQSKAAIFKKLQVVPQFEILGENEKPGRNAGLNHLLTMPLSAFVDGRRGVGALDERDAVNGVGLVCISLAGVGDFLVVAGKERPAPVVSSIAIEGEIHG